MYEALAQFLPVCMGVFIGTMPLLGVIGWAAFQNNHRLSQVEDRLKTIKTKLDGFA